MSKTADDVVNEAAAILGKYVPGEALGAVEHDTIDGCIDPVLAEVSRIVYIGDRNDIPDEYFQTIARLVAIHAAAKFSNAPVDLATIAQHEGRLRYLSTTSKPHKPVRVSFF